MSQKLIREKGRRKIGESYLNPEGLDGTRTALVHGKTVGEINDLVLSAVDHQHRRCHFRHLINTAKNKEKRDALNYLNLARGQQQARQVVRKRTKQQVNFAV